MRSLQNHCNPQQLVLMPMQFQMSFWPKYLWLGFFPQLIFWVGFTILAGSLSGVLTVAFLRWNQGTRLCSSGRGTASLVERKGG